MISSPIQFSKRLDVSNRMGDRSPMKLSIKKSKSMSNIIYVTSVPVDTDTDSSVSIETSSPVDTDSDSPISIETTSPVDTDTESTSPVAIETNSPVATNVDTDVDTETDLSGNISPDSVVEIKTHQAIKHSYSDSDLQLLDSNVSNMFLRNNKLFKFQEEINNTQATLSTLIRCVDKTRTKLKVLSAWKKV